MRFRTIQYLTLTATYTLGSISPIPASGHQTPCIKLSITLIPLETRLHRTNVPSRILIPVRKWPLNGVSNVMRHAVYHRVGFRRVVLNRSVVAATNRMESIGGKGNILVLLFVRSSEVCPRPNRRS